MVANKNNGMQMLNLRLSG